MVKPPAVMTRKGNGPGRRAGSRRWPIAAVVLAVAVISGFVFWSKDAATPEATSAAGIDHVHGLGVNPGDGSLYAATHSGVFRFPEGDTPQRVGEAQHDTMGFTVAGADHFLASGHPAPGQDGPAHLGLIESTDGGRTWKTLSLSGGADFHALRYRHDTVFGLNSTNGQLLASRDKTTWDKRADIAVRDFAVSPTDPDTLLATTLDGMARSVDGGRTWAPASGPQIELLNWPTSEALWGITATGDVMRSSDSGATWTPTGRAEGEPTAFAAHEADLFVAVRARGILRSSDAGATWTQVHP